MIIFIVNTTIIFFVNIMILTINNIMTILVILISSGWSVRRGARGDRAKGSADARQSSPCGHSTWQGDPYFHSAHRMGTVYKWNWTDWLCVWPCPSSLLRWLLSLLVGFTDPYIIGLELYIFWKLLKNTNTNTKTTTKTKTQTKCLKNPIYAIILKSWWLTHSKYDDRYLTLVIQFMSDTLVTLFRSYNQFYRAECITVSGFFRIEKEKFWWIKPSRIVGQGKNILGCSQRLTSHLWRSARII